MYSYYYVYVFLLLYMFRSRYYVSLCCSVYCSCVNVYCTTTTGCQPNCSFQIYHISNKENIFDVCKLMCENPNRDLVHTTDLHKPMAFWDMMPVIWQNDSCETSVAIYKNARHHVPENGLLDNLAKTSLPIFTITSRAKSDMLCRTFYKQQQSATFVMFQGI